MVLSKNFELRIHIYLDDVDGPSSCAPRWLGRPKESLLAARVTRSIYKCFAPAEKETTCTKSSVVDDELDGLQ